MFIDEPRSAAARRGSENRVGGQTQTAFVDNYRARWRRAAVSASCWLHCAPQRFRYRGTPRGTAFRRDRAAWSTSDNQRWYRAARQKKHGLFLLSVPISLVASPRTWLLSSMFFCVCVAEAVSPRFLV